MKSEITGQNDGEERKEKRGVEMRGEERKDVRIGEEKGGMWGGESSSKKELK